MKSTKTYAEKLRDPRWQKKRLEIFQAAGWACQHCKDETKTLHAHHKEYKKGAEPWEYDLASFLCLCEKCHESVHDIIDTRAQSSKICTPDGEEYPPEAFFLGWSKGTTSGDDWFQVCPALHLACFEGVYCLALWHTNPPVFLGSIGTSYLSAIETANAAAIQIKDLCLSFFKGGKK